MIEASVTVDIKMLLPLIKETLKRIENSWKSTPDHEYEAQTGKMLALMHLEETALTLSNHQHNEIEVDAHIYVDMIRAREYNNAVEKNNDS